MAKNKDKKKPKIPQIKSQDKYSNYKFSAESKPAYWIQNPVFSFTHYIHDNKKWSFECINNIRDFYKFFENLKRISSLTWGDIEQSHEFHFHPINWRKDNVPDVIKKLPENIKGFRLVQFKAFGESRIVGFFNSKNVFEFLLVDKNHLIFIEK
ncbi:MAG: hypothetical protein ACYDIA_02560 [Candidatus Humimicrobiaceae bacterium]